MVHSVHGIMFKDLKQILRKEQCDMAILLTAHAPSAKKIIVHGPQGKCSAIYVGTRYIACSGLQYHYIFLAKVVETGS